MRCGVVRCVIRDVATTLFLDTAGAWTIEPPPPDELAAELERTLGVILEDVPDGPAAGFFGPLQLAAVAEWIGGTVEFDPAYQRAMAAGEPGVAP